MTIIRILLVKCKSYGFHTVPCLRWPDIIVLVIIIIVSILVHKLQPQNAWNHNAHEWLNQEVGMEAIRPLSPPKISTYPYEPHNIWPTFLRRGRPKNSPSPNKKKICSDCTTDEHTLVRLIETWLQHFWIAWSHGNCSSDVQFDVKLLTSQPQLHRNRVSITGTIFATFEVSTP